MLYEFLDANHDELVDRCRAKVAKRPGTPSTSETDAASGIPALLDQLVDELRREQTLEDAAPERPLAAELGGSAGKHGSALLRRGYTVDQVVHDYGDLCQCVTELAYEMKVPIRVEEFHTFNRCLDGAIADAVTEFGRQRDRDVSEAGIQTMNERLGGLAHELRNVLNTAMLAFNAVKGSNASVSGATGAVLGRSLLGLRDTIDRSLADVRLTEGLSVQREYISIRELFAEIQIAATMEAASKGLSFTITPVDPGLQVDADRPMIFAAIGNLLQNAFKFTRPKGHVTLTARAKADRVAIEVVDECGGLPSGDTEMLFRPFVQRGVNRTGAGLGLSISRRGVEANGGKLGVRDLPGTGCVFVIDLPAGHAPVKAGES